MTLGRWLLVLLTFGMALLGQLHALPACLWLLYPDLAHVHSDFGHRLCAAAQAFMAAEPVRIMTMTTLPPVHVHDDTWGRAPHVAPSP